MQYFQLDNGIKIIHQEVPNTSVGHLGMFIKVGSRDEQQNEEGIAHFLEHVLFKGTKKRRAYHILNRLDSVGGELNAYTTKEETCVYAGFLTEHLERSVELISDIVLNSTFPATELRKEKEVVLDEIQSYKDTPAELIFEEFDNLVFKGHPLGNDILGTEEAVKRIKKKDVESFVKKHYTLDNIVVSSVGSYSLSKLVKLVEKHCVSQKVSSVSLDRVSFSDYKAKHKEIVKDTFQCHSMIGTQAYSMQSDKRLGLILLTNILGGPAMNSRLNLEIRERYGITYSIEANYNPFSDSGLFSIYFGTDQKQLKRTHDLIYKELKRLRERALGVRQLSAAKQQLKGQLALGLESKSGLMQSMGKSYLNFDRVDTIEESLLKIDAISSGDLLEIANEIFDPNQLSSLTYLQK